MQWPLPQSAGIKGETGGGGLEVGSTHKNVLF